MAGTGSFGRAAWGAAQFAAPRLVLRLLGGRPSGLAAVILRILGARNLIQSAVTRRWPSAPMLALGAAVDGLHALTAVALAAVDCPQRRAAGIEAAIATAWSASGARAARRRSG